METSIKMVWACSAEAKYIIREKRKDSNKCNNKNWRGWTKRPIRARIDAVMMEILCLI